MKTRTSKKSLGGKRSKNKDEGLLTSMAESIGSTIGNIVGSATAAQEAMTPSRGIRNVEHGGKKLAKGRRRSKTKH
jgi:hypothetical protein